MEWITQPVGMINVILLMWIAFNIGRSYQMIKVFIKGDN